MNKFYPSKTITKIQKYYSYIVFITKPTEQYRTALFGNLIVYFSNFLNRTARKHSHVPHHMRYLTQMKKNMDLSELFYNSTFH